MTSQKLTHQMGDSYHVINYSQFRVQLASDVFNPLDVFPLTPIVNKSFNIECSVNKMLQIIQNLMVSQGLVLELSVFRRTTKSGQHLLV